MISSCQKAISSALALVSRIRCRSALQRPGFVARNSGILLAPSFSFMPRLIIRGNARSMVERGRGTSGISNPSGTLPSRPLIMLQRRFHALAHGH